MASFATIFPKFAFLYSSIEASVCCTSWPSTSLKTAKTILSVADKRTRRTLLPSATTDWLTVILCQLLIVKPLFIAREVMSGLVKSAQHVRQNPKLQDSSIWTNVVRKCVSYMSKTRLRMASSRCKLLIR